MPDFAGDRDRDRAAADRLDELDELDEPEEFGASANGAARPRPPTRMWTARDRRVAEAGALAVVVFWAANFIVVKSAIAEIPPLTFAFIRFGGAGLLLLGLLRLREGAVRMPWSELRLILGLGAIGFGIYQILWATALSGIPAGTSAFLIAATPVMTAFVAVWAGSDVASRPKLVGGLVSFAGVAIVILGGVGLALERSLLGDLLTLTAAFCWAIYTSFGAPVLRRHSPLRTTAWAMMGGAAVLAIPGLLQALGANWSAVEPGAWAGLLYSGLIPAGAANVVIFHGIRLLGPTRITAFQFLVPFITAVMGAVALSEPILPAELLGGAVIVLGVAITRLGSRGRGFAARLRVLLPLD